MEQSKEHELPEEAEEQTERDHDVEETDTAEIEPNDARHQQPVRGNFICYILQSVPRASNTYVGITNHWERRLRQHNGELVGGARRTRGLRPWRRVAYICGFADRNAAERFEWSMHHPRKRRLRPPHRGVAGRLHCARQLLARAEWAALALHEDEVV